VVQAARLHRGVQASRLHHEPETAELISAQVPSYEARMGRPEQDVADRDALGRMQGQRLRTMLVEILPGNAFYAERFARAQLKPADIQTPADLARLAFTTKSELLADQVDHPPYGSVLTYPLERYSRMHQTSGTSGQPLRWLDTAQSWSWCLDCWRRIYDIVNIRRDDRLFFPFSFGPFLGFWTAFEEAGRRGLFILPAGGMSSAARLRHVLDHAITVVLCTPTYALRLAEVAREEGIDLASSAVRALIVAGEPGGSVPAIRERIESAWGARVYDHSGMTEAGPLMIECNGRRGGMHVLETECIAEVIDPGTGLRAPDGEPGELVLTNLGRWGSPLLRYRTGDLARIDPDSCPCGRIELRLKDGILGRTDDMIHVRGNNVYPSAVEALIRQVPEVAEYRVEVDPGDPLPSLNVEVEPAPTAPAAAVVDRVDRAIRDGLLFRARVVAVAPGSLPRFEMKARRVLVRNKESAPKK
jgi:phenylacetate-CoA ligase